MLRSCFRSRAGLTSVRQNKTCWVQNRQASQNNIMPVLSIGKPVCAQFSASWGIISEVYISHAVKTVGCFQQRNYRPCRWVRITQVQTSPTFLSVALIRHSLELYFLCFNSKYHIKLQHYQRPISTQVRIHLSQITVFIPTKDSDTLITLIVSHKTKEKCTRFKVSEILGMKRRLALLEQNSFIPGISSQWFIKNI